MRRRDARPSSRVLWPWLILLLLTATPVVAEDDPGGLPLDATTVPGSWGAGVLDLASRLPVQAEGRVKPFSTWADFFLLRISGRTSFTPEDGTRMSATAWALDTLFFPEQAFEYPVLLVEDRDALVDIGLAEAAGRKRDRYRLSELAPGWEQLQRKADTYGKIADADRGRIETQVLNLYRNVRDLAALLGTFEFARHPVQSVEGELASTWFHGAEQVSFSDVLARWGEIGGRFVSLMNDGDPANPSEEVRMLGRLLGEMDQLASRSGLLALLPPIDRGGGDLPWASVADLVDFERLVLRAQRGDLAQANVGDAHIDLVRRIEALEAAKHDPAAFAAAMGGLLETSRGLAQARGEYDKIETEVFFYRLDPFFWALVLFVLGFVLVAVTWAVDYRPLRLGSTAVTGIGEVLLIVGITLRCVIRDRPPVSTLYETVLFITAVAVLVCFLVEAINRRRIALIGAPLLGALGLFVATRFELLKGEDTMPQLQAVLDTNYWLTLHVLSVTIGYSAGLLASAVGHVYVLGRAFGIGKRPDTYASIARTTYGMVCFGLLFSLVGTILGGVWANDSWGRFWGWDPKENGALLIVLWNVIILHARMGGYIKAFGTAMAAIFGGLVVSASWWGVNLLGIGLHSYGFTEGIAGGLLLFAIVEVAVLATGGFWFIANRKR